MENVVKTSPNISHYEKMMRYFEETLPLIEASMLMRDRNVLFIHKSAEMEDIVTNNVPVKRICEINPKEKVFSLFSVPDIEYDFIFIEGDVDHKMIPRLSDLLIADGVLWIMSQTELKDTLREAELRIWDYFSVRIDENTTLTGMFCVKK